VELKNDLALVWRELPGLGLLELLEPAGELRLPPLQQVLRPRVRLLLAVKEYLDNQYRGSGVPGYLFRILIFFHPGFQIQHEQKRGKIFFFTYLFFEP
jgi:hypothetical protein